MSIKCKLGLHEYKQIGIQTAIGTVGGFSMSPLLRVVEQCVTCHNIHFISLDIATNAHLDNTLNWQPKLTI
jgi:hypothetical protein